MQRSVIIAVILILISTIFTLQNSGPVTLNFWFWTITLPVTLLVLINVLTGGVLILLFLIPAIRKRNSSIRKLKEELDKRAANHPASI